MANEYTTFTVHCSGPNCHQVKGEVNHWFKSWQEGSRLVIGTWNHGDEHISGVRPLCGERCSHNALSEWFESLQTSGSRGAIGKTAPLEATAEV